MIYSRLKNFLVYILLRNRFNIDILIKSNLSGGRTVLYFEPKAVDF